jgi:acyl carrier protein
MIKTKIQNILTTILDINFLEYGESIDINNCDAWDSMSHLKLILELERVFSITFSDDEFIEMTSFNEILKAIKRHNEDD